jgi:hypothetical protein
MLDRSRSPLRYGRPRDALEACDRFVIVDALGAGQIKARRQRRRREALRRGVSVVRCSCSTSAKTVYRVHATKGAMRG